MKDFFKKIKLNEGNISLGLGIFVMLIAGVLLVNYFRSMNSISTQDSKISSASTEISGTPTPSVTISEKNDSVKTDQGSSAKPVVALQEGSEYTVVNGDSLWKISEKTYGSGYQWSRIYEANKSKIGNNPGKLMAGVKLQLPKSESIANKAVEYSVKSGDNLWNISTEVCGSGFSYPSIAQANNISQPSLIQPGLKLMITCPVRT